MDAMLNWAGSQTMTGGLRFGAWRSGKVRRFKSVAGRGPLGCVRAATSIMIIRCRIRMRRYNVRSCQSAVSIVRGS